jgi:hypothetical protein
VIDLPAGTYTLRVTTQYTHGGTASTTTPRTYTFPAVLALPSS